MLRSDPLHAAMFVQETSMSVQPQSSMGRWHQIDLSRRQVLHRRSSTTVGHKCKSGGGQILELDGTYVRGRTDTAGSRRHFVLVQFDPGNQLLQVVRRHRGFGNNH